MSVAPAAAAAIDADRPTLHIRCGSDIREGLTQAGFTGAFLEVSDPICQGPVPDTRDLAAVRAAFIADRYGLTPEEARTRLDAEARGLATAAEAGRVVLWFEHDSYDQLILARILAGFATGRRPPALELICLDHWPGIDRFTGLGQLAPGDLRTAWDRRRPVTDGLLALGTRVWDALRRLDPTALGELATSGTPDLPVMAGALTRHLQELPWTGDGLSLTERLSLRRLKEGPMPGGRLFHHLATADEPLPFLGDIMHAVVLEDLAAARQPAVHRTDDAPWPRGQYALTDAGRAVLEGQRDWRTCGPRERWLGGVRLAADTPDWRWDPGSATVALRA